MKGGKRQNAGRPPGAPNKSTAEVKAIAQKFGPSAIKELAALAGLDGDEVKATNEAARIAALKEVLDRAYGKPAQAHAGPEGDGPIQHNLSIRWLTEAEAKARGWA